MIFERDTAKTMIPSNTTWIREKDKMKCEGNKATKGAHFDSTL